MKHLKSLTPTLAALALVLCLLAACGGQNTPDETAPATDTLAETVTPTEADTPAETEPASETVPDTVPQTVPETLPESEPETEAETFEVYEEIIGNVRIQLYSPTALRIEQAVNGKFCDKNTLAVTNRENWSGVEVTRTAEDGNIILTTATYTVTVPENAEFANNVKVKAPDGESLWNTRLASSAVTNLPEPAKTRRYWSFNDCPRVTMPENGFTEVYAGTENNGFTIENNVADYYVFICEGSPFTLRSDYNRLVGSCELVTVKALGLWFSRYYAYKDNELLRLVTDYRRRGYPIDYIVCDTDWKVGGSTGYDINTYYFPDMADFLAEMHEKNVNVAFNDHVRDYSGSLLSSEQLTWFNRNLTDILELGLDTWWYDRNWHYALKSPFAEINGDMLGQMMYQSVMQAYNAPPQQAHGHAVQLLFRCAQPPDPARLHRHPPLQRAVVGRYYTRRAVP